MVYVLVKQRQKRRMKRAMARRQLPPLRGSTSKLSLRATTAVRRLLLLLAIDLDQRARSWSGLS